MKYYCSWKTKELSEILVESMEEGIKLTLEEISEWERMFNPFDPELEFEFNVFEV